MIGLGSSIVIIDIIKLLIQVINYIDRLSKTNKILREKNEEDKNDCAEQLKKAHDHTRQLKLQLIREIADIKQQAEKNLTQQAEKNLTDGQEAAQQYEHEIVQLKDQLAKTIDNANKNGKQQILPMDPSVQQARESMYLEMLEKTMRFQLSDNESPLNLRWLNLSPLKKKKDLLTTVTDFIGILNEDTLQKAIGVTYEELEELATKIQVQANTIMDLAADEEKLTLRMQTLKIDCVLMKKYLRDIHNKQVVDLRKLFPHPFSNLFDEDDDFVSDFSNLGEDAPEVNLSESEDEP
jgi:hypothetical protein